MKKTPLSRVAESQTARHLLLIAAVSIGYESLFIGHWMNIVDEGLTLYAAMGVHSGRVLYEDVSFVFPPGHLLVAWISYALDPPGVILSRVLYAAFNVALCLSLYPLARRLMPARYALFGVLLVAIASPLSHRSHLLFGFRYLVWSVLALWAYAERLRTGNPRWMLVAGFWIGVAVCFRLTPAFAAAVGIGFGVLASSRDPRGWLRDGGGFVAGGVAVVVPVVAWFASSVGLETLWREVVVRPVVMTDVQSIPVPPLSLPMSLDRDEIHDAFVALLFRVCALVYIVCTVALLWRWLRALREGRHFQQPLLLTIVIWGGVYYLRSLGRSDEPHLSSAIPPFCVVVAFAVHRGEQVLGRWASDRTRSRVAFTVCAGLFAAWVFLPGADRALDPDYRGHTPFEPLGGRVLLQENDWWHVLTPKLRDIRERTGPEDIILNLSASPLLYVILDRLGPGRYDTVMPGTFLTTLEEQAFVEQLKASPPSLAILPATPFDQMVSRSLARVAPRLMAWIGRSYEVVGNPEDFLLLVPRPQRRFGEADVLGDRSTYDHPVQRSPILADLDTNRPIDRMLAELARELDENQATDLLLRLNGLETRLGWFEGKGSFHRPPTTIGIGRDLVAIAETAPSLETLREPLRLVLAHGQAHGMQSRIYTEQSLSRPANRRLVEAQADLLAGITLVQSQVFSERPFPNRLRGVPVSVMFSRSLGASEGTERIRLDDRRRVRLLEVGRKVGLYYVKVWTCVTNLGEDATRDVFDNTVRSIQRERSHNPLLPRFDPRSCEAEDVFDWTLRAAQRVLADSGVATGKNSR